MEGLHQQRLILDEQASEVRLDQRMLCHMAHKALSSIMAKDGEILTAREKARAELENTKRRLAVMTQTCMIQTTASLYKYEEQLIDFIISEQEERDCSVANRKLLDELKALFEVVFSNLDQLYDQKMEELNQLDQERNQLYDQKTKELAQFKQELAQFNQELTEEDNDDLSTEDVVEGLINLIREIGSLTADKGKEHDELRGQLEVLNSRAVQLRDAIALEKDKLQKHTQAFSAITWENLPSAEAVALAGAEIKKSNSFMKIMLAKLKVQHELQAHLAFTEKLKVFPKFSAKIDEEVPEMVRRIKKWESEGVNADTIIGLKEIGVDDKELWNTTEDRVATLNEAISYLVMMLRVEPVTD